MQEFGATIPFEKVTEEDFDRFLNIHFKSIYFLCQQSLPMLNDNGRIINISTGTTRFCNPGYSVYSSMKGAIEVFTKYLAKESGPRLGKPEDMGGIVAFLCSEDAGWITGQRIEASGGIAL
jgi:NAD(P)-dependent dehydrogenase (short-subunit alcohol dehydrogenase family)